MSAGEETIAARAPSRGAAKTRGRVSVAVERYAVLGVWAAVIALFGVLRPDTFLTVDNMSSILGSQAVLVVLTLALLVPLTAGDYDLSVAANLTFSAMLVSILNVNEGWAIGPAILLALAVGATIGAINGALTVLVGIESIIVTLGMGTFVNGVVLWVSSSQTVSGVSNTLVDAVIVKEVFSIPLGFYYGLALCVVLWYVFDFTPMGRRLLVVGRNRRVAQLNGVRVGRVRWGSLICSGLIAALAGVLYAGTIGGADPASGNTFLLPAFAAAFLGTTTIYPGRFNPWGSLVAVYFLVTGITGLQLLGVESFVQNLFYGGALIVAVVFSQLARRREALGIGEGG
jgi:ribose transport system permease protein